MPPTILVVEDDAVIRAIVHQVLSTKGYQVVTASRGAEAMAVLAAQRPDVLILDVMLPDGDGPALYAQLQTDPRIATLPVIWMTAHTGIVPGLPYDAPRMIVMTKPFAVDTLVQFVVEVLASPEGE